jgi:hypothetical protein
MELYFSPLKVKQPHTNAPQKRISDRDFLRFVARLKESTPMERAIIFLAWYGKNWGKP